MGEFINSKQMQFHKSHVSCGILECHHIPSGPPNKNVFAIATALYHKANPRPAAFVIFSDSQEGEEKRGHRLASKIKEIFGAEAVYSTKTVVNPRTGNRIVLWVWILAHEQIRKWYQDELANALSEE